MKPPVDYDLPYAEWRPGQQRAIRATLHAKTRYVVIQAPTGSGKSAIVLGSMQQDSTRAVALTATKGLQEQYAGIVPWLADIRGMANYPCLAARDEFRREFATRKLTSVMCDEGPCKLDVQCSLKNSGCRYFDAYREFVASKRGLTSYAYWLASHRYGRGLGHVSRLYCDEAHTIADQLASACQLRVPHREAPTRPKTINGWRSWASKQLHEIGKHAADLPSRLHVRTKQERYEALRSRLDDGWAFDDDGDATVFEPVDVRQLTPLLVQTCDEVTLLSATVTAETVAALGIPRDEITFHTVPMRFPVEHRPVYCLNGGRIDHRSMQNPNTVSWWLHTIDHIIKHRTDRKGIIHTVSYERQQQIVRGSEYHHLMLCPRSARDLPAAIAQFRAMPQSSGAILVSPSIVEGYDFAGQDAEYQILSKLPFPFTRNRILQARLKAIPHYREIVTAQKVVQATGRIVRSEADMGETFIVDEHMRWFLNKAGAFFPSWFLDAVVVTNRIPAPPSRLAA